MKKIKNFKKILAIMMCCVTFPVSAAAQGNGGGIYAGSAVQTGMEAEVLNPETPSPEASSTEASSMEAPSPEAPSPEASSPETPSMEALSLEETSPDVTDTEAPEPGIRDGWRVLEDGGQQYYYGGKFVTGFQTIGKAMYYFDQQGYLMKNSWVMKGSKKYRTDKRGIVLKDKLVTISKKTYYFRPDGTMLKGWKKFKNGKSYFAANGVRVTGLKKIGGKSYFFNAKGIMQTGVKRVKSTTYYLNDKGVLEARKTGSKYYDGNGKVMSKVKAQDFETLQNARAIAGKITTSKMSKSEKLKKCFDWVISKPYVTRRVFTNFEGWPAVYANDHFVLGGGNCLSDAAAFAYLAKVIGYTKIYVCTDSKGTRAHSWAEVGGLVYDPLFAESKSYSRNYGVSYGVYPLSPIVRIAL